ncbi:hypothetical protein KCP73_26970 (plasmid) [Salmonella enterica subsp. enterica]|nr:hypothetical protein KCP73_26970 [Salmonella enterica subsp. enterica]
MNSTPPAVAVSRLSASIPQSAVMKWVTFVSRDKNHVGTVLLIPAGTGRPGWQAYRGR